MTLTADARPAASGDRPSNGPVPPRLAEGIDLIGEYEGSGYKEPPSLVRRADGQVIQLTPLLYTVAEQADGSRDYAELAHVVGQEIGRALTADNIRFLVEERLAPLGVVTGPDGAQPAVDKADPLLALKFRTAVIPQRVANVVGRIFMPLFHAPIVVAVLGAFVAADVWLFGYHGVAQAVRQSVYHPGLFLPLFAAVVLSAGFHEIGHAAACRFGGAKPGKMGCGLYLAWPAFYTDVTDAYRLGKRARLRTDLGGVYFNVIVVLATVGAYLATGFEPLLLLVIIMHVEIAHQLLPVVRLDGYYIVADLTGVPDLFNRIGPIMRGMVPWRKADERVTVLKRWVRMAVTAWVLIVVPLLLFQLVMILVHLPRILGTSWDSGAKQWHTASASFGHGDLLSGITGVLQIVVLAVPVLGIVLMLVRVFQKGGQWTWQHTEGKPVFRMAAVAAGGGLVALLAMAWLPKDSYTPIKPQERGTLAEGVVAVRDVSTGRGTILRSTEADRRKATSSSDRTVSDPSDSSGSSGSTDSTTTTVPATSTTLGHRVTSTTASSSRSTTSTTGQPTTTSTTGATSATTAP
ncbi:MAG: putative peptide zinc metalloprotease protein [Acidimicrobiaceae bacterium]|jgi:putative peptide zinc metalloprotease protein|nr:putative peptide zinc metalloprotease protein [Acidimicrobiaceae bacterium]